MHSDEEVKLLAQAFSHFSYEPANGKSIIADRQGVGKQWTDPQMHSMERCYGHGDLGLEGIKRFVSSHECNRFRRRLCLSEKPSLLEVRGSSAGAPKKFKRDRKSPRQQQQPILRLSMG